MKASCNVTVSIDFISVNSIEQAVLEGAREAGKKLFLAFLELIEKTPSNKEHFVIEAQRYGVFQSQEVIFVSDGVGWCRKLWEEYFTEAISVLDFWHLARNIKVSLGAERISRLGRLANPLLALRLLKLNGEWESY